MFSKRNIHMVGAFQCFVQFGNDEFSGLTDTGTILNRAIIWLSHICQPWGICRSNHEENALHYTDIIMGAHNGVSNHQPQDCLLKHLLRRRSKKTSKLHLTVFCAGNSTHKWPVTRKMFQLNDIMNSSPLVPHSCISEPSHQWLS